MANLFVNETFQFRGMIRRAGSTLEIGNEGLKSEVKLGKHPDNDKPLSGLLNHCSPADEETARLCGKECKPPEKTEAPTAADKKAEVAKLQREFDKIGKAFHPAWTLARLRKELIKAKKEVPAVVDTKKTGIEAVE